MSTKLGIFGGSFDPIHVGHLIVAEDAAAALGLDRVVFVPAGTHALKRSSVEAPGSLRRKMVEAATAGSNLLVTDGREVDRSGPSYTVDTLAELAAENPGAELFLLLGTDILGEIHEWHRAGEVAELAQIVVMTRPGAVARPMIDIKVVTVEVTQIAVSSSEIRRRVKTSQPYRYLVPDPVYRLIVEHSLYAVPAARQ